MKKLMTIFITGIAFNAVYGEISLLDSYKEHLETGTYEGQNWSSFSQLPKSRYYTFKRAFEHFERHNGKIIVELGTSRSYVHGGLEGCNSDELKYWQPHNPASWDWGAGFFTRMVAEALAHCQPKIYTVDLAAAHIARCKVMTAPFASMITYHVCSSLDFLRRCAFKIDLLYLDTGDMTPIEPTAQLQLEEARIIVERDLIAQNGIVLIDDVRNQTPKQFGESSDLGKSKYALPYLLQNGFEIVENEYQVIVRKR